MNSSVLDFIQLPLPTKSNGYVECDLISITIIILICQKDHSILTFVKLTQLSVS